MKKTLLDFILGNVTKKEAAEFYRALAADEQEIADAVNRVAIDLGRAEDRGFAKSLQDFIFGRPEILDLGADGVENLLNKLKEREDTVSFELSINSPKFDGFIFDEPKIRRTVQRWLLEKKQYFNSYQDLSFDPNSKVIKIRSKRRAVKEFLMEIGLDEKLASKIANDSGSLLDDAFEVRIPLNKRYLLTPEGEKILEQYIEAIEAEKKKSKEEKPPELPEGLDLGEVDIKKVEEILKGILKTAKGDAKWSLDLDSAGSYLVYKGNNEDYLLTTEALDAIVAKSPYNEIFKSPLNGKDIDALVTKAVKR